MNFKCDASLLPSSPSKKARKLNISACKLKQRRNIIDVCIHIKLLFLIPLRVYAQYVHVKNTNRSFLCFARNVCGSSSIKYKLLISGKNICICINFIRKNATYYICKQLHTDTLKKCMHVCTWKRNTRYHNVRRVLMATLSYLF